MEARSAQLAHEVWQQREELQKCSQQCCCLEQQLSAVKEREAALHLELTQAREDRERLQTQLTEKVCVCGERGRGGEGEGEGVRVVLISIKILFVFRRRNF